jgi:N-acetylmuramoyl-L-alanine amidase
METRHGNLEPGISRIVFDLNRPVSIQSAFTLPASGEKPPRLVIDFANASPSVFATTNNSVYGNLSKDTVTTQTSARAPEIPAPANTQKPLVIIDAGHGGVDPGAIGDGIYERNITLALAKELKSQLERSGHYRVKLTRDTDTFIKLGNRVKFARQNGGDLFISLHADALDKPNVSGASVYTLSEKASDAQTAKLAARENKVDLIAGVDLETEDKEVADILMDLAMRETMNQSKFFANTIVQNFKNNGIKTLDTAHRSAGFAVLKAPDIPSVLVEAGFISNKKEAQLLNTPGHRQKIATALKDGIDAYFQQVAKNQRM